MSKKKEVYVLFTGLPVPVAKEVELTLKFCASNAVKEGRLEEAEDIIYELKSLTSAIAKAETEESEGTENE